VSEIVISLNEIEEESKGEGAMFNDSKWALIEQKQELLNRSCERAKTVKELYTLRNVSLLATNPAFFRPLTTTIMCILRFLLYSILVWLCSSSFSVYPSHFLFKSNQTMRKG